MEEDDGDGNDSDLEAELAAITSGGGGRPRPKPKAKPIPTVDLDRMVAESLKDVDDDDSDIDENDPDLLNELSEIVEPDDEQMLVDKPPPDEEVPTFTPTSTVNQVDLIKVRIEMYKTAESNAKAANDSSKARRFNRGLKTLEGLLKQAKAGKTIPADDIPPEVTTKVAAKPLVPDDTPAEPPAALPTVPTRVAPAPPPPSNPVIESKPVLKVDEEAIEKLLARQREYKVAALQAKKSGNNEAALNFVKISKMFDAVIKAAQEGQPVDLSDMPPSPQASISTEPIPEQTKQESESQNKCEDPTIQENVVAEPETLITASTILEALVQRLEKYKAVEQAAKDEDNSSKARRLIDAIKYSNTENNYCFCL